MAGLFRETKRGIAARETVTRPDTRSMTGITDFLTLLASLQPRSSDDEYFYLTQSAASYGDRASLSRSQAI